MTAVTKAELQQEVDRLKAKLLEAEKYKDDPLANKVQSDLWTHEIYLTARKKMTVGVLAILSFIAVASGSSLYIKYNQIVEKLEAMVKETMVQQLSSDIAEMIDKEKPAIKKTIDSEINALTRDTQAKIETAKSDIDEKINLLNINNTIAEQTSADADAAVAQIKQTLVGMEQRLGVIATDAEAKQIGGEPALIDDRDCKSVNLDENLAIRQEITKTGDFYQDKRYFRNTFTVVALDKDNKEIAGIKCAVGTIDRIVYRLTKKWFDPSEFVRLKKDDKFRFSMKVWGVTPVKVDIYLKGAKAPLTLAGRFSTNTETTQYLNQ